VRQRVEVAHDWLNTRLNVIRTVSERDTGAPGVCYGVEMVVVVEVVKPRPGVGILNQITGRHSRISVRVGKVIDIAGEQKLRVWTSAPHDWLMVIIADRVVLRQIEKVGEITRSHAVIAHCNAALIGILVRHRWVGESPSHRYRDPGK